MSIVQTLEIGSSDFGFVSPGLASKHDKWLHALSFHCSSMTACCREGVYNFFVLPTAIVLDTSHLRLALILVIIWPNGEHILLLMCNKKKFIYIHVESSVLCSGELVCLSWNFS
jgi:hypothetical protein